LWLLLSAIVIGTAVFPVSAGFYHPRGLLMSTYPQQVLVFYQSEPVSVQLIVIIMPPWYFVDGLYAFDTVTLTVTLKSTLLQSGTDPLRLLGGSNTSTESSVTAQWTNVALGQDENGAIEGAYLLYTITFVIDPISTAGGYYLLFLSAQAAAGDVLFTGWDQAGVSFRPGHVWT